MAAQRPVACGRGGGEPRTDHAERPLPRCRLSARRKHAGSPQPGGLFDQDQVQDQDQDVLLGAPLPY
jgi:hypothetical protein